MLFVFATFTIICMHEDIKEWEQMTVLTKIENMGHKPKNCTDHIEELTMALAPASV